MSAGATRRTIEEIEAGASADIGARADSAVTDPTADASMIAALKGVLQTTLDIGAKADSAVTDPTADASMIAALKGVLQTKKRFLPTDWEAITTDLSGSIDYAWDLLIFNEKLYVATGQEVGMGQILYTSDGETWIQSTEGFGDSNNLYVTCLREFNGYLYAGTYNTTGGQLWRSADGTTWTSVTLDGFGDTNNLGIISLCVFDAAFYALTYNPTSGIEVWKSSNGTSWTQANTDGFGNSNVRGSLPFPNTMIVFNNYLYASGYSNVSGYGGEIWRSADGTTWEKVCDNGLGDTSNRGVTGFCILNEELYCTVSNVTKGTRVFKTSKGAVQADWIQVYTNAISPVTTVNYGPWVYNGFLYFDSYTSSTDLSFMFRSLDGTTWTRANIDGFGLGANEGRSVCCAIEWNGYFYIFVNADGRGKPRLYRLLTFLDEGIKSTITLLNKSLLHLQKLQDTNFADVVEIAATDSYGGSTPDLANDGAYDYTSVIDLNTNNYKSALIFVKVNSSGTTDDIIVSVFAYDGTDYETVPSYSFQIDASDGSDNIVSFLVQDLPNFRIGLKTTGTTDTFDYRISAQYLKRGA